MHIHHPHVDKRLWPSCILTNTSLASKLKVPLEDEYAEYAAIILLSASSDQVIILYNYETIFVV